MDTRPANPHRERPADSHDAGAAAPPGCALSGDALADRIAWLAREILPHVSVVAPIEGGVAVELAEVPGLAAKLDRLIELERACCPGLRFERSARRDPGRLRLEVRGLDPRAGCGSGC